MLGSIGEGLLDHAVQHELDLRGKATIAVVESLSVERDVDRIARTIRIGVCLERRDQAQVVEGGRAQLDGQLAHGLERLRGQLPKLVDLAAHLARRTRAFEDLETDQQRRECLGRLVVQLT